jgi:hypothetical protein
MLARKPPILVIVALANKTAHHLGADDERRGLSSSSRDGLYHLPVRLTLRGIPKQAEV